MSRSSSGGLGPARGTGLESRVLAWLAAHMLAGQPLSDRWAPGGATVTSIGGQTARPIDDVGALTSVEGHLLIQAKTRLERGRVESSELAKAIRQVVTQYREGIPANPEDGTALRAVDPDRDRLLIVTDIEAPLTTRDGLIVAAEALGELPDSLPFTDVGNNENVVEGRKILLDHLRREWKTLYGAKPTDADLRGLLRVLRFVVVDLRDDGTDHGRALQLLGQVVTDASSAMAAWRVLTTRCHELAERNHWMRDDRLRQKLASDGVALGPRQPTSTVSQPEPVPPVFRFPRRSMLEPSEPKIGVGEGNAAWTHRFHTAYNALNGPMQLGEATSGVETHGPGVAQHFGAVWVQDGWVLTALPGHLPIAIVDSIWNAIQDATASGVADLGLPSLDSTVPAGSRIIGPQAQEVRLTGGARGAGRLTRPAPDAAWTWQPDVVMSMDGIRLSRHWTPQVDQFDLRVRVAVTMPWNAPGQHISIAPEGRSRLEARLPGSGFASLMAALSASRGEKLEPGPWQASLRPRSQSLYSAVYVSTVGATANGSALLAEVRVTTPNAMQTYPVAFAELQIDYDLWGNALGLPSEGQVPRATVAELAAILDAAWQTAAEIAPLIVTPDPVLMPLAAVPTAEFHIQPCPRADDLSVTLDGLADLDAFGPSTFGPVPEMCVALTASLALSEAERHDWVRKSLVHVAHAFGYIAATETTI